jgi:hypothetical protein
MDAALAVEQKEIDAAKNHMGQYRTTSLQQTSSKIQYPGQKKSIW